jgi:hypothetical protein
MLDALITGLFFMFAGFVAILIIILTLYLLEKFQR